MLSSHAERKARKRHLIRRDKDATFIWITQIFNVKSLLNTVNNSLLNRVKKSLLNRVENSLLNGVNTQKQQNRLQQSI